MKRERTAQENEIPPLFFFSTQRTHARARVQPIPKCCQIKLAPLVDTERAAAVTVPLCKVFIKKDWL
jgi:hypothetical protein